MATILHGGKKLKVGYKITFPRDEKTYFVKSVNSKNGFFNMNGVFRYHTTFDNKIRKESNMSVKGIPIIKIKLGKDYKIEIK